MDPRERNLDMTELLNMLWDGRQAELWTTLPGIVQSWNPTENTVTVLSALKMPVKNEQGVVSWVQMPLFIHCPVHWPGGGPLTLTFPIAQGDEGTIMFAARCIDAWWQSGGVQQQIEFRMHDLSDGFFFPKVFSKPNVPTNISTTAAQLRSNDGEAFIELEPNGSGGYKIRFQADDVELLGKTSWSWNVNGYGTRITWTGGSNFTIHNWTEGVTITTVNENYHPPDIPEGP